MRDAEKYGTPEEMAAKEAIMKVDFSEASGEAIAALFQAMALGEGEAEALSNLPQTSEQEQTDEA